MSCAAAVPYEAGPCWHFPLSETFWMSHPLGDDMKDTGSSPPEEAGEFRWHRISSRAPIHISQKQTFLGFTPLILSCTYYNSFSNSFSIPHFCPREQKAKEARQTKDTYGRRWMSESAIECPGLCSYLKADKYEWSPLHRSAVQENVNWVGCDAWGSSHLKQNEQVDGREKQEQCFSSSRGLWGLSCCTISSKSN